MRCAAGGETPTYAKSEAGEIIGFDIERGTVNRVRRAGGDIGSIRGGSLLRCPIYCASIAGGGDEAVSPWSIGTSHSSLSPWSLFSAPQTTCCCLPLVEPQISDKPQGGLKQRRKVRQATLGLSHSVTIAGAAWLNQGVAFLDAITFNLPKLRQSADGDVCIHHHKLNDGPVAPTQSVVIMVSHHALPVKLASRANHCPLPICSRPSRPLTSSPRRISTSRLTRPKSFTLVRLTNGILHHIQGEF